jgi:hypothetical protein
VLERKKHHSNKHHTDSHGEDNGLSNGHVRTKEQSKRKTASVNAEAADSSTTNGATATVDGVSKENGHSSPKAEKRNAERESRKRKEKKEKRDSTNKQHSLADDKMEDEQEEPTVMDQAVAKGTEHAAETEAEPEAKEKDPQADTPSDEDGDDNGESADGFSKSVSARSIDWAEMAEEGEDEVSDTRHGFLALVPHLSHVVLTISLLFFATQLVDGGRHERGYLHTLRKRGRGISRPRARGKQRRQQAREQQRERRRGQAADRLQRHPRPAAHSLPLSRARMV